MRRQTGQIFQSFKRPLFRNERSHGYAHWLVLRDPYKLSKKYYFATLTQI